MQEHNIDLSSLSKRKEITDAFLGSLTPCELRVWNKWFPSKTVTDIMLLRVLRGRRFPLIQGGKIGSGIRPFSHTPAPLGGGHAA